MPKGFTLIEVLVVLVIIGVVVGATLFTVRAGGEERVARDEVRRLEHAVTLLADESVQRMAELGLQFHARGYRVLAWDGAAWVPHGRARTWPDGLGAELVVEARATPLPPAFPPGAPRPEVVFLSSGEVSAFTLSLRAAGGGERLTVHAHGGTEREPLR